MCTSEHAHADAACRGCWSSCRHCGSYCVLPSERHQKRPPAVVTGRRTRSHLSSQASSQTRPFSSGHAARRDNDERLRKHRAAAEIHVSRRVSCKTEYRIHARVQPATSGQQETSRTCAEAERLSAERPRWSSISCQPCTLFRKVLWLNSVEQHEQTLDLPTLEQR